MNGHDTPGADPIEALLDRIDVGDPLADEVERLLNETGGPVPVDEGEVRRAAASVHARIVGQRAARRPGWGRRLLVAAVALIAAGAAATIGASPEPPDEVAGEVDIRTGSRVAVRADTVVLTDGAVSVSRDGEAHSGAHRVRIERLGVTIEPIGTVFHVGTREDLGAVWVVEGRVRVLHDAEGHLGEIGAGGWALLSAGAGGLEVRRLQEGAFDAVDLDSDAARQLVADIRWMALPPETRAAILGGDAP